MNLKIIEKSRKLLIQVMGQETFDKFVENGKIEIKHGNTVYELDQDARVYNRTNNQSYCIEPICPDSLPVHDQLAIKYSYLKNKIERVEQVANKRNLGRYEQATVQIGDLPFRIRLAGTSDIDISQYTRQIPLRRPDYSNYVEYMENQGWRRSQLTLDERNSSIVTTSDVPANGSGSVIDLRCPLGRRISVMGIHQIPAGMDPRTAYSLRVRLTDEEDNEIPFNTRIIIRKVTSGDIVQLSRVFYSDINFTRNVNNREELVIYKTDNSWYRFQNGIEINGEEHLDILVINCERNICARNTRFAFDCDLWVH